MDESRGHYVSEISQSQKDKYCYDSTLDGVSKVVKFTKTENRMRVTGGCGKGERESYCLMGIEFQTSKMKKFCFTTM